MKKISVWTALAVSVALALPGVLLGETAAPALSSSARIVFCGDSITGQGVNFGEGFIRQIGNALKAAEPGATPQLVSLGGSGQSVGSWLGVEKQSRDKETRLDAKAFDAKEELSKPADALVIMLGMNDVLAPYIDDTADSVEKWAANYAKLVAALRERVKPKVTVLGTITLATEDPDSPKNRLIARMNERLRKLAAELGCRVAPANEECREILRRGRALDANFHVTWDFVHPSLAGHTGIALAMLKAMGYDKAAKQWADTRLPALFSPKRPAIGWQIGLIRDPQAPAAVKLAVSYVWNGSDNANPVVRLVVPAGWKCSPEKIDKAEGTFTLTADSFSLRSSCRWEVAAGNGETFKKEFTIPAPWLACSAGMHGNWGHMSTAPAEPPKGPLDEAITAGTDLMAAGAAAKRPLEWKAFLPGPDYTGLDDPGNVDFYGVAHAGAFELGYGVRYITSAKEREVNVILGSKIFAGNIHVDVWLNGAKVYGGRITSAPGRKAQAPATLKKGKNTLVFKSSHVTWQWQQSVGIEGKEGDDIGDLRVSLSGK